MAHFTPVKPFRAGYMRPLPPIAELCNFDDWAQRDEGMPVDSEIPTPPAASQIPGPIYGLPADVLISIFTLGTQCDQHGGNFPITVSQVCGFWRKIALDSPLLWTKIRIGCTNFSSLVASAGPVLPRASSFVTRSAQCAVDIKLDLTVSRSRPNLPDHELAPYLRLMTHASVDLIAGVHDRIRSLDVTSDGEDITFLISHKVLPLGMPCLKSWTMGRGDAMRCLSASTPANEPLRFVEFDVSGHREGWLGPQDSQHSIAELLPRLRNLQLSRTLASWASWLLGGLTSLTINHLPIDQRPSMSQLRSILTRNMDTLESLELHGSLPRHLVMDMAPVSLPKLRHLRLGYLLQHEAVVMLQNLDMPALRSLSLCDISCTAHRFHRRVAGMIPGFPINVTYPLPAEEELDSGHLLHHLHSSCRPLMAKLESLELVNVQIISTLENIVIERVSEVFLPKHICAVRLLMSMPSLKTLTLDGPDPTLLHCLNQPVAMVPVDHNAKPRMSYLTSKLSTLRIFNAEYDDFVDFLSNRTDLAFHVGTGFPQLQMLEFTLEEEEKDMFNTECHSDEGPVMLSWLTRYSAARIHPRMLSIL